MRSCFVSTADQPPGTACLKMKGSLCSYRQNFSLLKIIAIVDRLQLEKALLSRKAVRKGSTSCLDNLDNREQKFQVNQKMFQMTLNDRGASPVDKNGYIHLNGFPNTNTSTHLSLQLAILHPRNCSEVGHGPSLSNTSYLQKLLLFHIYEIKNVTMSFSQIHQFNQFSVSQSTSLIDFLISKPGMKPLESIHLISTLILVSTHLNVHMD